MDSPHDDPAGALGLELMSRIATVMPVTPVPLVAHALHEGVRSVVALDALVRRRIEVAQAQGVTVHIPRDDIAYTIEAGLRALIERRILQRTGDRLRVPETGQGVDLIAFYAASVAHLLRDTPKEAQTPLDLKSVAT
jgi:glycerol-3-phosphate O-acyltransferase